MIDHKRTRCPKLWIRLKNFSGGSIYIPAASAYAFGRVYRGGDCWFYYLFCCGSPDTLEEEA
jgi:hypothetical protein